MKYAVDEIIDDKVVIIDLESKETKTINKELIDGIPYDGMILEYKDDKYVENSKEYSDKRAEILKKFNRLIKKSKKSSLFWKLCVVYNAIRESELSSDIYSIFAAGLRRAAYRYEIIPQNAKFKSV